MLRHQVLLYVLYYYGDDCCIPKAISRVEIRFCAKTAKVQSRCDDVWALQGAVRGSAKRASAENFPTKISWRELPYSFSPSPAMNAEAYLRKQGWQGSGHSLDTSGRGIKKPLLIAHKNDQLGLGKKKAAHTTDDQWWMRAFDQSLQAIGTGQDVCA